MSTITDYFSDTKDDRVDTLSSCNGSFDCKKQSTYELPPYNSKCYKRSKIEQECVRENWSVQQLPVNFETVSKPSSALAKYKLAKKNDHEIALQNFKNELQDLHKSCDTQIDILQRNIQDQIDKTHDDIEKEKLNFCEIACLDDEKYECLESTVESMLYEQRANIDELSEQIRMVEKERQSNAIRIFKKFYQIVRKLCHVPVDEHKSFFEKEIAGYNQMVLENNKNYEKVKLKFRLSVDVMKQNFYIWIKDVKDDRIAVCRKNALDDFYAENEKFNNAGLSYSKKLEGQTALCRLKNRSTIFAYVVSQWDLSVPFPATRFHDQSICLNSAMSSTDMTIAGFIKSYKFYITKHLGRLFDKVKRLRSIVEMMESEDETGDEELNIVEDIYEKAKQQADDFIAELETTWSNIFKMLDDKAKEVFQIFVDFGSPWDLLSATFLKQQDTVAQQLQTRATKNEAVQLDLHKKIIVEVPKLREEENIQKLEKKLAQILAILEKREQKYKSDFEEDCKIIKKSTEVMDKEVNITVNKLDKFLDANKTLLDEPSKDNESIATSYESGQTDNFYDFKFEEIVMHDLELIANQVDVLDEWKSKFFKNMFLYRPSFEKEIMVIVEMWQDALINEAFRNLEGNLKSLQDLQFDIRRDVYDIRFNELMRHQKHLEEHKEVINRLLNEPSRFTDKLLDYTGIIEDYKVEVMNLIKKRSRNIQHSSQIKCLQNMIRTSKNNYSNKIDKRMNASIERLIKKIAIINYHNESFFSEVILFKDGGAYSSEEANIAKKEMMTLIKSIQKDESTNRITISKITDQALLEINNFEKSTNENLSITLEKLKVQEDVMNATMKCEQSMVLRLNQAVTMNKEMMCKIAQLIQNCQNKVEVNEIISTLNETINSVIKTLDIMKGPFPEIDIPNELQSSFYSAMNNGLKNVNAKKLVNEPVSIQGTCDVDNFPTVTSKLIFDALAVVTNKAMIYYTDLIHKKDELLFSDQNDQCENCINNTLQKLNVIYVDSYNFWIDEAYCLSKFFESIEMPSIEWYLRDESIPDEEKAESNVTLSTMGSDPNHHVSLKFNDNVIDFQSTLQEILHQLQLKNTNGPLPSSESENLQ